MTQSEYPHFTEEELRCRDGCGLGADDMDDYFMRLIVRLRMELGFPLPVTSAIRCAAHDALVSTARAAGEGPHTTGRAVDISAAGMTPVQKHQVISLALEKGMFGVGSRLHGPPDQQFIHLDNLKSWDGWPRPAAWTYA